MKTIGLQPSRGRTTNLLAVLMLGLVFGLGLGITISVVEAEEPVAATMDQLDIAVRTLGNSTASLAVDTERSAIGIASLDARMAKIERRVAALGAKLEED